MHKISSFLLVGLGIAAVAFAAGCDEGSSASGSAGEGGAGATTSSSGTSTGGSSSSSAGGGSGESLTVIDDMEDMNGSINAVAGMQGAWYTYNDMTAAGMQTPESGPTVPFAMATPGAGTSMYAANTKGSGFTTWGAGFGFDLNNDGTTKKAYDASQFAGITFNAKIGAGSVAAIRFNIGDSQTTPEAGNCGMKCSDDFGQSLTLTAEWQKFKIAFADMKAVNWSMQNLTAINKASLWYVHFQASQNNTFDIWVDDVAFYK